MATEVYTGHVSAMRADAEFLGAEDIMQKGDVPVQIVECLRSTNRKACGKSQAEMFTLRLATTGGPCKKEMWLKPTNRKQLVKLYGANVGEWRGKWIWLYVDEVNCPTGGKTLGVRIRDKTDAPTPTKKQPAQSSQEPEEPSTKKQTSLVPSEPTIAEINACKTMDELHAIGLDIDKVADNAKRDALRDAVADRQNAIDAQR